MAQYTTFDQIGKKEDVSDVISNISPSKTPFQSMIGGPEKVKATLFEWQEDSLRAVAANARIEGFTATYVARVPTVLRNNVTQILEDSFEVTGTADAISTYGRAKETAYQMAKAATQLKRDLEHAYVGTAAAKVTPADNATARVMASAQAQIDTTMVVDTGGVGNPITEAFLLDAIELAYDEGSEPSIVMVTPADSLVVATFAAASGRTRDFAAGKKIVNAVDLYVSPFGEQRVVLNRFLKSTDTLIFDPDMWVKVVLRPWFREAMAKVGDAARHQLVGEYSLKHKNFFASAAIIKQA